MSTGSARPIARHARLLTRLAGLGVTVALLLLLIRQTPTETLRATTATLRPELLAAAGAFYLPVHLARAARFRALLGPKAPSVPALTPLSAAVSFLNHVLVSRAGDAAFVPLASRYDGIEATDALAAIGVARLLDLLTVALFFLASTLWSLGMLPGRTDALLAAAALALLSGGALLLLGPAARWARQRLSATGQAQNATSLDPATEPATTTSRRSRLRSLAAGTAQAVARLREAGAYRPALLTTLLAWGLTFAWLWLLVAAVGREVAFAPFVVGATFGTIAKALPLPTIGGHGLAEAGWALGFTAVLGWPLAEAVAVGLAVSALTVVFAALYGLPSLVWLAMRPANGAAGTVSSAASLSHRRSDTSARTPPEQEA